MSDAVEYTFEDALKFELPDRSRNELYGDIVESREPYQNVSHRQLCLALTILRTGGYKESVEYLLSESTRDKAISACNDDLNKSIEDKLVAKWLIYANKLSASEKLLRGWTKV